MPYSQVKKYGLKFILQPMLTPYLGILFNMPTDISKNNSIYNFQEKHTKIILEQLPKDNALFQFQSIPEYNNWLPFYFAGFEQTTRYTYILKDIKDSEKTYSGFSLNLRKEIEQGYDDFVLEESENICLVFELMKKQIQSTNKKFNINKNTIKLLDKELSKRNQRKILIARNKAGKIKAGIFICWDSNTAYLMGLGIDRKIDTNNSTKSLMWEAIKKASEYVDYFNFEGSMIPGVELLYRRFGGELTPYFEIKKYKNKFFKSLFLFMNK
ncbi:MAG: hypothetical protein R2771_11725 [Saprospiraceae bacterium]